MKPDASRNVELNGIVVLSQKVADRARVALGEKIPWAEAFPRPELRRM